MPGFPIDVEEIRDGAVPDPVHEIPESAAPDKSNSHAGPGPLGGQSLVHFDEEGQDDHGQPDEELV